jgi:cation:H+ antiporter
MAALRRHADVAFGNVGGSNIFNILGSGGVTAAVKPIDIPPEIAALDVWVMLIAAVLLLTFACTGWRLQRREGAVLLAAYGGYMALQFVPSLRIALGIG